MTEIVRLMPVQRATGMRLARNIPAVDPQQMPLLRSNATLNERYARALADAGIQAVWIHDDLSDGIEPRDLVSPAVRERSARAVSKAMANARSAVTGGRRLTPEALADLHKVVDDIADSVAQHPGASVVLDDLAASDAYTHQHSIDVCALGLLIGRELFASKGWQDDRGRRRFDDVDRRLHLLGLGLLVHDVGKMRIPAEILNKPGRLTDEEMAIIRTHPDQGADMLSADGYSPLVRAVIREHHERWDGAGYANGLSGLHIHQLARIAAVADVYDAVTSERPYHPARPPYVGVEVILDGAGAAFDPEIVEVFRRVVHPYPIGSELRLPDGEVGVVARIDPEHPDCPWVRFPAGERPVNTEIELVAA